MSISLLDVKELHVLNADIIKLLEKNKLLSLLIKKEIQKYTIKDIEYDQKIIEDMKLNICETQNLKTDQDFQDWLCKSKIDETTFI